MEEKTNKDRLRQGTPLYQPTAVAPKPSDVKDSLQTEKSPETQEEALHEFEISDVSPNPKTRMEYIERVIFRHENHKGKKTIYISDELHRKLMTIKATSSEATITDIVCNIVEEHLKQYKPDYNRLIKKNTL